MTVQDTATNEAHEQEPERVAAGNQIASRSQACEVARDKPAAGPQDSPDGAARQDAPQDVAQAPTAAHAPAVGQGPTAEQAPTAGQAPTAANLAEVKRVIEALLFSSDRPVSAGRLAELSGAADGRQARDMVRQLREEYEAAGRAFTVEEIAGGFQVLTRPEFGPYVSRLHNRQQQESLTKAALETLAIVAYRQPITRAALEDIRGVQSGHVLRSLVERRLLKVTGKSDELGRPLLYGTTRYFLEVFGLRSLSDLPKRPEFGPGHAQPTTES
jgi:segregation and condensation protein B